MDIAPAAEWAITHPLPAAIAAATTAAGLAIAAWRLGHAVLVAAIGAIVCTAYSADTSWRFAEHRLDMHDASERLVMFAAAEIALVACGLLARATKAATATEDTAGTTGVPGILVWVITSVQVVPAYAESGLVGGTVRAVIGPVLAALLWHEAMGLEIRVVRPGALSTGLPAMIGRELRERLLSRLGLATRDRTAEQISRDRAAARAVRLASRTSLRAWGLKRLQAAVARADVATDPTQLHTLIRQLAARRDAANLLTMDLPNLYAPPQPPAHPRTPSALAHQQLTAMHPMDAIQHVHRAHPDTHPATLASLLTAHGVVVTEQMVRIAIGAGNPPRTPERHPHPHPGPKMHPSTPNDPPAPDEHTTPPETEPAPDASAPPHPAPAPTPEPVTEVHPNPALEPDPEPEVHPELIERARALGRPAPLRTLKRELRVGQSKAQRLQQLTKSP
ncbi:hypothetical protein [Streptomyces noursei]|uniref:hypothetical protein n=1 Tax=Streptomyces noursei TaxID=1971 RepID=UPI0023B7D1E2|nr:hypothetical protein [Streptomyces noursei]